MFIAAWLTRVKRWRQSKCPLTDEWIKKICCYIYTHTHIQTHIYTMDYYSAIEGKKILSYGLMGMNLGDIKLSKMIMLNHMILLI